MKCDFCNKKPLYSLGVITDEYTPVWACEEHEELGRRKQQNILREEEFKDRLKNFGKL